jgi:hypothetical protein
MTHVLAFAVDAVGLARDAGSTVTVMLEVDAARSA